jgi:PPM family protein phosphatase
MKTAAALRAGIASDPGLQRTVNEDRVLADDVRGVFLVIDGLGGHAAGEMAAETALRTIQDWLDSLNTDGDIEAQIRRAITEANNRIHDLAAQNEDWRGMACVLTLAVAQEERITVGHVGDSRLYLAWNGNLRKITSDHSPVGEQEEHGELTEDEAMRHPRRNEVFRDVGSHLHAPDDPQFIEIRKFLFRPDAALLLCSDGLSDVVTSTRISAIVERYDGNPERTAQQLVEAANAAGGKDNISVVFVAGPEFLGGNSHALLDARPRHAITRMRPEQVRRRGALKRLFWLITGVAAGIALWALLQALIPRPQASGGAETHVRAPARIMVDAADAHGIIHALARSLPGDTIEIPPGEYLGPIELKERVNITSTAPRQAILKSNGVAVIARGLRDVRLEGIRIAADPTHGLRTGIWISDSSIQISDVEISGADDAGIRIDGSSSPTLLASFIHDNSGAGVLVKEHGAPRLTGNWITENGKVASALRGGLELESDGQPGIENNVIVRNGLATLGNIAPELDTEIRSKNLADTNTVHGPAHSKIPASGPGN